jgi:hypothetical protein
MQPSRADSRAYVARGARQNGAMGLNTCLKSDPTNNLSRRAHADTSIIFIQIAPTPFQPKHLLCLSLRFLHHFHASFYRANISCTLMRIQRCFSERTVSCDNIGMSTSPPLTSQQMNGVFFAMLKSLDEFDEREVRGVIGTLLSPSDRETCFIATYRRASANVATLLELKVAKHFQASSMLARALFELAVDIRLINVLPDSCEKMIAFVLVEKLRCARKIIKFKADYPSSNVDTTIVDSFVANNATNLDRQKARLWPKGKVDHWSGISLGRRVELLDAPFKEIYEVHYPALSWQVHSGLTGVVNLKAETFALMCGRAHRLAVESYGETLLAMIEEFKLAKGNETIKEKMRVAKFLPFTESLQQAEQLQQELTS